MKHLWQQIWETQQTLDFDHNFDKEIEQSVLMPSLK